MKGSAEAYFLTVDWCAQGERGVFCDGEGRCFRKDGAPHTELEMQKILGPFWVILAAKSELLTAEQLSGFTSWRPLEEYSNRYGVALKLPIGITHTTKEGHADANGQEQILS